MRLQQTIRCIQFHSPINLVLSTPRCSVAAVIFALNVYTASDEAPASQRLRTLNVAGPTMSV